ncbi:hypothetical protein Tco_1214343 [Tanacetum coccineum]
MNVDTTPRYMNDNQIDSFVESGAGMLLARENCRWCSTSESNLTACRHDEERLYDSKELEARYISWQRIRRFLMQDSGTDSEPLEQWKRRDSNVIPDSPDMCDNDIQNDQNVIECDDERVTLGTNFNC